MGFPTLQCRRLALRCSCGSGAYSGIQPCFLEELQKGCKRGKSTGRSASNPQALILAEHYGDPSGWLQGDEWDSIMNYDAFMEPVTWFLTGMEKHSDSYNIVLYGNGQSFFDAMAYHMSRMQTNTVFTAMNQLLILVV